MLAYQFLLVCKCIERVTPETFLAASVCSIVYSVDIVYTYHKHTRLFVVCVSTGILSHTLAVSFLHYRWHALTIYGDCTFPDMWSYF